MADLDGSLPWVVFELKGQLFAVNSGYVKELITIPKVVGLPHAPETIRGVISLRGQVVTLMDTRIRMGLPALGSETAELINMLDAREQDHHNWLAELDASVREGREFGLTTDPHRCAFGVWYDQFETDNPALQNCLEQFDTPHKAIHAVAVQVKALVAQGEQDRACALVDATRDREMSQIAAVFAETRTLIADSVREIAVVLEWQDRLVAISVDSVTTVEGMAESRMQQKPEDLSAGDTDCVKRIGRRDGDDALVQMLDVDALLEPIRGLKPPSLESIPELAEA